ncbi:MAG: hypothetical protein L3J67_10575, partial [Hyphomicrobiaceae bacterium]|nr:hypothetical protein [Hyphomicrobiaceae bacterium]
QPVQNVHQTTEAEQNAIAQMPKTSAWQRLRNRPGKLRLPAFFNKKTIAALGFGAIFLAAGSILVPQFVQNTAHEKNTERFPKAKSTARPTNIARSTLVQTIRAHTGAVTTLRLSGDGRQLISSGADRMVKVWNMADGILVRAYQPHNQDIVALDVRGNRLAQADKSGNVSLYDLDKNEQLASFTVPQGKISTLAFAQ